VKHFDLTADDRPSFLEQASRRAPVYTSGFSSSRMDVMERCSGVTHSLHDAAAALRRAVVGGLAAASNGHCQGVAEEDPVDSGPAATNGPLSDTEDTLVGASSPAKSGDVAPANGERAERADTGLAHDLPDPRVSQLEHENAELRAELSHAAQRLAELEDQRQHFFDEGIYDLMNLMCRTRPATDARSRESLPALLLKAWGSSKGLPQLDDGGPGGGPPSSSSRGGDLEASSNADDLVVAAAGARCLVAPLAAEVPVPPLPRFAARSDQELELERAPETAGIPAKECKSKETTDVQPHPAPALALHLQGGRCEPHCAGLQVSTPRAELATFTEPAEFLAPVTPLETDALQSKLRAAEAIAKALAEENEQLKWAVLANACTSSSPSTTRGDSCGGHGDVTCNVAACS